MTQTPPPDESGNRFALQIDRLREIAEENREIVRLRNQIEKRKLELELASLNSVAAKPRKPERLPIESYETQITNWHNRLPQEARQAPRAMEEFVRLLKGRTPGLNAHPAEISTVLKRLGWKRTRTWKADGEGRRMWFFSSST